MLSIYNQIIGPTALTFDEKRTLANICLPEQKKVDDVAVSVVL